MIEWIKLTSKFFKKYMKIIKNSSFIKKNINKLNIFMYTLKHLILISIIINRLNAYVYIDESLSCV